jgi:hypothetical protein
MICKGRGTRFHTSGFFRNKISPGPLNIPLGPFYVFKRIRAIYLTLCLSTTVITYCPGFLLITGDFVGTGC